MLVLRLGHAQLLAVLVVDVPVARHLLVQCRPEHGAAVAFETVVTWVAADPVPVVACCLAWQPSALLVGRWGGALPKQVPGHHHLAPSLRGYQSYSKHLFEGRLWALKDDCRDRQLFGDSHLWYDAKRQQSQSGAAPITPPTQCKRESRAIIRCLFDIYDHFLGCGVFLRVPPNHPGPPRSTATGPLLSTLNTLET